MKKIGFLLLSNSSNAIPSTRIVVLNMLPYLRAAGFDPHIVFEPKISTKFPDVNGLAEKIIAHKFDVIFLQKVFGESVLSLVHTLREAGIKTIFSICDFVNPAMCEATDATIVVTDYLKSLYPDDLKEKVFVVHDGVEKPHYCKSQWSTHRGTRASPLKAVLVTSAQMDRLPLLHDVPPWLHVTIVGAYSDSGGWMQRVRSNWWQMSRMSTWVERWRYLRFLLNFRISCVAWGPQTVYEILCNSDIGIIPIEVNPLRDPGGEWKVKSENRLTLMMGVGLPVVATPIPAYEPVIDQGNNGFLARNLDEWWRYLTALRDPHVRRNIGLKARSTALAGYSMDLQASRLIAVLRKVTSESAQSDSSLREGGA